MIKDDFVGELKIRGLTIIKKEVNVPDEIDGKYKKIIQDEYLLYFTSPNSNNRYKLHLYKEEDMCPSGYSYATWGFYDLDLVKTFGKIKYVPVVNGDDNNNLLIQIDMNLHTFKCDYFSWSRNGGEPYYPEGYVEINMEMFEDNKNLENGEDNYKGQLQIIGLDVFDSVDDLEYVIFLTSECFGYELHLCQINNDKSIKTEPLKGEQVGSDSYYYFMCRAGSSDVGHFDTYDYNPINNNNPENYPIINIKTWLIDYKCEYFSWSPESVVVNMEMFKKNN